ncbi:GntR family transcriptional regulator [Shewanella sp. OPT22]|nr:GntR family transcriptional regulator [Shewanella sp. OPT22]
MLELIHVNPSSGEPIYRQLHEQIVRLIVGGQLQPDQVLPSVRQIAEFLSVNPMTVSRAIQQLVEQGWIVRQRGQPTRVAATQPNHSHSGIELLQRTITELVEQAKQLGVPLEDLQQALKDKWQG